MAHEPASAFQQTGRIGKLGTVEESNIDMGLEDSHVGERRIVHTGGRISVMHDYADIVAAIAHGREPALGDSPEWISVIAKPGCDVGVMLSGGGKAEKSMWCHGSFVPLIVRGNLT